MTRYYETSREGKALIAHLEGIGLTRYLCSANEWTIGIGATKSEIPDLASWPKTKAITIEEAFELLDKSLVKYENAINKVLTRDITQYTFDALVSWCYNVGVGWPAKSTLMKRINMGQTGQQLYDAMMMFKKPPEIIERRKKEANLLVTGRYAGEGKALVFPVNSKGRPVYKDGKEINVYDYIK